MTGVQTCALPIFLLGKADRQDAVPVVGGDLIGFDGGRQGEAANKFAVAAFDPVITLDRFVLFELAEALQGQGVVFDADIDVFGFDIREVGLEGEVFLGLKDVDGGRPGAARAGLAHEASDGVLEEAEALEWICG